MGNFKKCGCGNSVSSRCPQCRRPGPGPVGPPGPPGPAAEACCPCTNLLANPGFDQPAVGGDPVPGWDQMNATEVGSPNVHSGRFLPDGTLSILAVQINPRGHVSQRVPVSEGCCYTLSFAADVRAQARLVASVSFGNTCPPDSADIRNIPHIVPANRQSQNVFQHFTLVVCVPTGVTSACVAFQNLSTSGEEGSVAFVDNAVFQPTGGPCLSCMQNF